MFILLSLIFAPSLVAPSPQARDLRDRVRDIIDRHFLELPDERRKAYTDKIVQACRNAVSPQQLEETLAELPEAAFYHASVVQQYKNRAGGFEPPSDVLLKGYDIQIDQLHSPSSVCFNRDHVQDDSNPGPGPAARRGFSLAAGPVRS